MRIVNEIAVGLKKFDCEDGEKRKAMPFQKKKWKLSFLFCLGAAELGIFS